jgi:hypothetical protein
MFHYVTLVHRKRLEIAGNLEHSLIDRVVGRGAYIEEIHEPSVVREDADITNSDPCAVIDVWHVLSRLRDPQRVSVSLWEELLHIGYTQGDSHMGESLRARRDSICRREEKLVMQARAYSHSGHRRMLGFRLQSVHLHHLTKEDLVLPLSSQREEMIMMATLSEG